MRLPALSSTAIPVNRPAAVQRTDPTKSGPRLLPRDHSEHAQSRTDGLKGQLNRNPLDFIQSNLILPPVVELRRAGRLVVGDVCCAASSVPLFFR